jgi:hypothetical protein
MIGRWRPSMCIVHKVSQSPTLCVQIVCYCKQYKSILSASFFHSFALWLVQYVSGGSAQTQLGGAQKKHVASCYAAFWGLYAQYKPPKTCITWVQSVFCDHPSFFFEKEMDLIIHIQEKQEVGNAFVLPAITKMCTYNVEGSQICN